MIKKNKTKSGPDGKDRILKQDIDMAVKDYCKENPSDNAFKYWKDHASSSNPIKRAMAKLAEIYLTPQSVVQIPFLDNTRTVVNTP